MYGSIPQTLVRKGLEPDNRKAQTEMGRKLAAGEKGEKLINPTQWPEWETKFDSPRALSSSVTSQPRLEQKNQRHPDTDSWSKHIKVQPKDK